MLLRCETTVWHIAVELIGGRAPRGDRFEPADHLDGSSQIEQQPRRYSISHRANAVVNRSNDSVSIGEPQLPIFANSQGSQAGYKEALDHAINSALESLMKRFFIIVTLKASRSAQNFSFRKPLLPLFCDRGPAKVELKLSESVCSIIRLNPVTVLRRSRGVGTIALCLLQNLTKRASSIPFVFVERRPEDHPLGYCESRDRN